MIRHKFAIGQIVDFDARLTPASRPSGPFEVVRVLPAQDANSQTYQIKSKSEPFERSAKEYEIVAVDLPAVRTGRELGAVAGLRSRCAASRRPVRSDRGDRRRP